VAGAEERFWAKVRHRGGHDVWTGFTDHRGVGQVRIDGKLRTAQRAAWEFAHGPIGDGARVNGCAAERACVRVDHLSLAGAPSSEPSQRVRRRRGSGSMRELRPGVWQVVVTEGSTLEGRPIRRYGTISGNEQDAAAALSSLAALVERDDLGDLRVRELIGRYLRANHDPASAALARDRAVLDDLVEPRVGDRLAAEMTADEVTNLAADVYRGEGPAQTRAALGLIRDAYRWARRQGWSHDDPTAGITLRTVRPRAR
jgi:hypothetical protein